MNDSSMQVAVITGASGGIGAATARRLSQDGFAIIAHFVTRREEAQDLCDCIAEAGGACWLAQADLTSLEGIDALVGQVDEILATDRHLQLRGLVNNAGRMLGPSFGSATAGDFDAYFALNTRAPLLLTQALSERMRSGGGVVNISSAAAHFSSSGDIVYAMSKAALESLTVNAVPALASRGIRINTVVPGFTDNGHAAFDDPDVREYMSSFSALGGVASPETVAEGISFLLSDKARRTTGTTLDVSGGSTIGARPQASHRSLRDRTVSAQAAR